MADSLCQVVSPPAAECSCWVDLRFFVDREDSWIFTDVRIDSQSVETPTGRKQDSCTSTVCEHTETVSSAGCGDGEGLKRPTRTTVTGSSTGRLTFAPCLK